ncbi:PEP-CTERM sorting domain-containing protein [Accumulibacter sp.]|uniref:PEP-CTERM sorting domain-containing protein n=1 Tax=Accumulibacter sp. TaxID=2053492 RepID=UPI0025FC9E05|nr:PEP-CTERM sorting domain-containing protein [Accumulibacter sp.]MCM8612679.1 PEPxxWA-CTERM sorting domain-containing protein [Accumulibacter sp.]MCM8636481.1 PEPxxWA-CTERM sorting domain-containing protein [Accumulibacter sp.]MCM8639372.1 PEPxxWA-CTERM sorting domain-containing protein [Accumulibacter sp.]
MKILPLARALAAATLATALANPALANTVNLTGFSHGSQTLTVTYPSTTKNVTAGQFLGTLDGNSFRTFCTQLSETFSFNDPQNYTIVNGLSAWGSTVYQGLNKLMSYGQLLGLPTNTTNSVVFQAAVWEVVYQTDGVYDFSSGAFKASSGNATTQAALNSWDWSIVMSTPITHTTNQLFHPTKQDFLVTTPVPEPESYAMMLAGLGLVGAIARRRRSAAN